jgi:bacillithiol biosynthesis cysteine-adding enzyme BshC
METSCIRQTALPNTTKLFADFTYHPDRVAAFYPYLPLTADSWREAADAIRFSREQREALVAALRVQNEGNPLLARLALPGTVAVVTGQQVGLLSGPSFTIYKALTAIRQAEQLNASGIPAVPIFWLATEDHDFAEVNEAWLYDAHFRPTRLEAVAHPGVNQPVGGVVLESFPIDEMARLLEGLPFADDAVALARETYRAGSTFGQAFAALLDRLLTGFPILRVDPMLPEFRRLAAPYLKQAVLRGPELVGLLRERDKTLAAAGYHSQVHVENSTSLFFLLNQGQRMSLSGARKFSVEQLAERGEDLSPNALLRPVIQDSMIPTIAYVGGPAELAYLAQSEVLYQALLGRQPIALHRAGFTLMSPHTLKLLERYKLELTDFFHGEEKLREKAAATLVDPKLTSRIDQTRGSALESLAQMARDLQSFDPSTVKALERSRRKIAYQFEKIARKVGREALLRHERAACDVASLTHLLFPRHRLQERLYSGLAQVAQFGPDLAARILAEMKLDCADHRILLVQ